MGSPVRTPAPAYRLVFFLQGCCCRVHLCIGLGKETAVDRDE